MGATSSSAAAQKGASASFLQSRASNGVTLVVPLRTQSLHRKRRLRETWQFRRFFSKSEVGRLSECTVFRIPNDLGHFRLGITLKARGSSVERNRVKRQVREAFRTQAKDLGSFDYNVVISKTKSLGHPYPRKLGACIRKELKNAFRNP